MVPLIRDAKLPLLTNPPPAITLRHEWSQDPSPLLRYVTPDTDPSLYHLFLFFEVEKKTKIRQRYALTHDTSTHVFMQLIQIVRFK